MSVQIIKHNKNCKFCKSPHADELNILLDRWQRGEKDLSGKKMNLDSVLQMIGDLGVPKPTRDNWISHRQHIKFVNAAKLSEVESVGLEDWVKAQQKILAKMGERSGDVADRVVETQLLVFEEWTKIQLERGTAKPATLDQIKGMIGEKTKRKASDAQDELLKALGGGIGMVFEKALGGKPDAPRLEQGDGDVVEAEILDVDEE